MGAEIEPWTTYRMQGTLNFLQEVTRHTLELFPQLEHARLLRSWAGPVRPQPRLQPDPRQDRGRELPRQRRLGHLRLQGRADRRPDPRRARRHRPHARPHRPLLARALLRGPPRLRARRRRRQPLTDHGAIVKSSLEIAQDAVLKPIEQIAEEVGLEDEEFEPYGRYKAKIDLGVLDRMQRRPQRQARVRDRHDADQGRRGQDDDAGRPDAGARGHRQAPGRVPARALARPGLRHQGRRRRRRHDPGRPDGGPQPALHRRHPRHRRGQQPARGDARRLDPARQPAAHRRAERRLAARDGHERPRPAPDHRRARRPRQRLSARERLRHHRGLRGHGHHGRRARPAGPAPAPRAPSPSRSPSTAAPRSPPRTSAPRARWPCCSRTRSSPT